MDQQLPGLDGKDEIVFCLLAPTPGRLDSRRLVESLLDFDGPEILERPSMGLGEAAGTHQGLGLHGASSALTGHVSLSGDVSKKRACGDGLRRW